MKPEILVKLALVVVVLAVVTESTNMTPDQQSSHDEGRGKKQEKIIHELMQGMMLIKNMISFVLMFVSPIIQIKGFGLSVINTLVNIGRFLIQLQTSQHMKQMHLAHLKVHYDHGHQTHGSEDLWSSGSNSHYAYYAPPPKQGLGHDHVDSSHTSYAPLSQQQNTHVYPQYSSDLSRMR